MNDACSIPRRARSASKIEVESGESEIYTRYVRLRKIVRRYAWSIHVGYVYITKLSLPIKINTAKRSKNILAL